MAEIKEGILGGVHGKVGTVIGVRWRGRNFLRALPRRSNKPASEKQIMCRSKFGIVSTFASKFKDFVNRHCPPALLNGKMAPGKEQLISMLNKEGVVIIDGVPHIDVSAVILSIGSLPPAVIKKINVLKTGRVKVAWDNSIVNLMTKGTDRLTLVAYHEDFDEPIEIESIGKREDKFVHFDLPTNWTVGNVHFWSTWKSANDKLISTSAYHGIVCLGETLKEEDRDDCKSALKDSVEEEKRVDCKPVLSGKEEEEREVDHKSNLLDLVEVEKEKDCNSTLLDVATKEKKKDCRSALSDIGENDKRIDCESILLEQRRTNVVVEKKQRESVFRSDSSEVDKVDVVYEPRSILEILLPTDQNREEDDVLDE
ncbi:MAG: DUF6266 family protein [Flavobacteriaceae bacterium]|jgi:hypothetical protein|nr:DUF6266 family protein [Flavobacteriaceae bacterium]